MPFYLRIINKRRWDRSTLPSWISGDDIPAQPLADLVPKPEEYLSLWRIDDDKGNLNRVIAAIAASRERIDKIDYALFQVGIVDELGLTVVPTTGKTADEGANAWHSELIELTANKIVPLAKALFVKVETHRLWPSEVERLVKSGIESKELKKTELGGKLLGDLQIRDA